MKKLFIILSIFMFISMPIYAHGIGFGKKAVVSGDIDHGGVTGLTDDDHSQYPLLAGRSGGQTLTGGTGSEDTLTFESTSNSTKGDIIFSSRLVLFDGVSNPPDFSMKDATDGTFTIIKNNGGFTDFLGQSSSVGINIRRGAFIFGDESPELLADGTGDVYVGSDFVVDDHVIFQAQDETCADTGDGNPCTITITPTAYVEITCEDANSCDVTLGETGIIEGAQTTMVNVGSNVVDFADSAGVSELAGAFAASQWDVIQLRYSGGEWFETSRSDN